MPYPQLKASHPFPLQITSLCHIHNWRQATLFRSKSLPYAISTTEGKPPLSATNHFPMPYPHLKASHPFPLQITSLHHTQFKITHLFPFKTTSPELATTITFPFNYFPRPYIYLKATQRFQFKITTLCHKLDHLKVNHPFLSIKWLPYGMHTCGGEPPLSIENHFPMPYNKGKPPLSIENHFPMPYNKRRATPFHSKSLPYAVQ